MPWNSSTAQRCISNTFQPRKEDKDLSNPLLEQYLKRREIEEGISPEDKAKKPLTPKLREGTMSKHASSLFLPEREIPGWNPTLSEEEKTALKAQAEARKAAVDKANQLKLSEMNVDPDPLARRRLERKLVISSLKKHGRLTKAQTIARTERQALYKSQNLPTSVKKLQKVVNQIAGKTVSEALVQLRFSKKKVARDVIKGIEMAQNEAIASRGMGLGSGLVAQKRWEKQRDATDSGKIKDITLSKEERELAKAKEVERPGKPVIIEMKDGSKKLVRDPTEIYIDQAWVGKGGMWKSPEFRARGMVNLLRHRTTSEYRFQYTQRSTLTHF